MSACTQDSGESPAKTCSVTGLHDSTHNLNMNASYVRRVQTGASRGRHSLEYVRACSIQAGFARGVWLALLLMHSQSALLLRHHRPQRGMVY